MTSSPHTGVPPAQLADAATLVEERLGLCFPPHRRADLARGLDKAAVALKRRPLPAFVGWLLSGGASHRDLETVASFLTIGETYLFRDKRCFAALEHHILPELIRRASWKRLRIWSAGCSSGEELYSIAILLDQLLLTSRGWSLTLLGTDINVVSLAKATAGIYTPWSFRERSPETLRRYIEPLEKRRYQVVESLRQRASFAYLNLAEDRYPSLHNNTAGMDLVLCRNVLMYFDHERAVEVVKKLARSLADGGTLFLGPSELHLGHEAGLQARNIDGSTCFMAPPSQPGFFVVPPTPPTPAHGAASPRKPTTAPRPAAKPSPPPPRPATPTPASSAHEVFERAQTLQARGADREATALLKGHLGDHDAPCSKARPAPMLLLARCLANLGRLHEAELWSLAAIGCDKMNAEAHLLRGTIQQEKGELDDAAASFRRAQYLDPDHLLVQFSQAGLARQRGDDASERRALLALERALQRFEPDDELPGFEGLQARRLAQIVSTSLARHGGEP
jgi:chemotaxis protein methyltransferase CheR